MHGEIRIIREQTVVYYVWLFVKLVDHELEARISDHNCRQLRTIAALHVRSPRHARPAPAFLVATICAASKAPACKDAIAAAESGRHAFCACAHDSCACWICAICPASIPWIDPDQQYEQLQGSHGSFWRRWFDSVCRYQRPRFELPSSIARQAWVILRLVDTAISLGARGEGGDAAPGASGLQHRECWGALAAMYRRSHGEGGCSGTLSFGIARRALRLGRPLRRPLRSPTRTRACKGLRRYSCCRAEMSLTLGA